MTETTVKSFPFDSPQRMTSGKHHRDPEPYIIDTGWLVIRSAHAPTLPVVSYERRPRAEFDNHDQIIASFRAMYAAAPPALKANAARHYLASVRDMGIAMGISEERRDHANRVLTKLANVYKED